MAWRDDLRSTLPFGVWVCADGREILFDKRRRPIWQRRPGQPAEPARGKPNEIIAVRHYYSAHTLPWRDTGALRRCQAVLAEWGLPVPTV